MTSSTSGSRARRVLAAGIALVAGLNAWVAWRLPALLEGTGVDGLLELERRVARFEAKDDVRVLVFGNSHALAGLRPPQLARAMGLGPNAVFSFALPAVAPAELRQLARRYAGAFPRARWAIVNLDGFLLASAADWSPRKAYLTRDDARARWEMACRARPDTLWRLGALATWGLPLADFGPTLRPLAAAQPGPFARRLLAGDLALAPGSDQARTAAFAYRWGLPPPWDLRTPAELAADARKFRTPKQRKERVRQFTDGLGEAIGPGLADMAAWADEMHGRGLQVAWVEMPIAPPLEAAVRQAPTGALEQAYDRARDAFRATRPEPWLGVPAGYGTDDFYDLDHLAPAGAQRFATAVARLLEGK